MLTKLLPLKEIIEKNKIDVISPYNRFIYNSTYIRKIQALSNVTEALAELKKFAFGFEIFIKKIPNTHNEIFSEHPNNVARSNLAMSQFMGLPLQNQLIGYYGGDIHDTGKIGVPDLILRKKREELIPEDFLKIQEHCERGYGVWSHIPMMRDKEALVALQHQERYNGTGYPNHLFGSLTSLEAKITQISDCYDAMTSPREYNKGQPLKTPEEAYKEIVALSGIFYDPIIVKHGFEPWFQAGCPNPSFENINFYNRMLFDLEEASPFYLEDIKQLIIQTQIGLTKAIFFMCDIKNSTRGYDPFLCAFYAARFAEVCGCPENEVEDAWYYGGIGGLYDNFLRDDVISAPDLRPFAFDLTKQLYLPQPAFQGIIRINDDFYLPFNGGKPIKPITQITRTGVNYGQYDLNEILERGKTEILNPSLVNLFENNLTDSFVLLPPKAEVALN
jgi:hypothetical protein